MQIIWTQIQCTFGKQAEYPLVVGRKNKVVYVMTRTEIMDLFQFASSAQGHGGRQGRVPSPKASEEHPTGCDRARTG